MTRAGGCFCWFFFSSGKFPHQWEWTLGQDTRWWFDIWHMFYFHPYLGKIPILTNIFQIGWNHQLLYLVICYSLRCTHKHHQTRVQEVKMKTFQDLTWAVFKGPWLVVWYIGDIGDEILPYHMRIIISKANIRNFDLNQSGFNGTSAKGFVARCSLVNLKIANATMGILEGSETSRGRRISKSSKDSPEGQGFRFSAVVEGLKDIFSGSILVKFLHPWFIDGQVFFLQGLIDSDFRCKGSCEWEGFGACRCELEDLQDDVLCFSGWPRHYKRPPSRTQDRIFWTSWVDAGRPKTWEISVGA